MESPQQPQNQQPNATPQQPTIPVTQAGPHCGPQVPPQAMPTSAPQAAPQSQQPQAAAPSPTFMQKMQTRNITMSNRPFNPAEIMMFFGALIGFIALFIPAIAVSSYGFASSSINLFSSEFGWIFLILMIIAVCLQIARKNAAALWLSIAAFVDAIVATVGVNNVVSSYGSGYRALAMSVSFGPGIYLMLIGSIIMAGGSIIVYFGDKNAANAAKQSAAPVAPMAGTPAAMPAPAAAPAQGMPMQYGQQYAAPSAPMGYPTAPRTAQYAQPQGTPVQGAATQSARMAQMPHDTYPTYDPAVNAEAQAAEPKLEEVEEIDEVAVEAEPNMVEHAVTPENEQTKSDADKQ